MICDDCIKKEACHLKERCNILEKSLNIENVISAPVNCKYRYSYQEFFLDHKQDIEDIFCKERTKKYGEDLLFSDGGITIPFETILELLNYKIEKV